MTTPARIEVRFGAIDPVTSESDLFDEAYCPACGALLATITAREGHTRSAGAHAPDGGDFFLPHIIGFRVTLAPGFVNHGTKHPSGVAWFQRARRATLNGVTAPVRVPCVIGCGCGEDVSLAAPFLGFDLYFRDNAAEPSKPRPI